MKISLFVVLVIVCAVAVQFEQSSACGRQNKSCLGGEPYYFGESDLGCMLIHQKRSTKAQQRYVFKLTHRWIQFRGMFYEWGVGKHKNYSIKSNSPYNNHVCRYWRESQPAGYSHLTTECMEKCVRSYRRMWGIYHIVANNCHNFANRMSIVLCTNRNCPWWCR